MVDWPVLNPMIIYLTESSNFTSCKVDKKPTKIPEMSVKLNYLLVLSVSAAKLYVYYFTCFGWVSGGGGWGWGEGYLDSKLGNLLPKGPM